MGIPSSGEPYYTPGCTSSAPCVFPNAFVPQSAFSSPLPTAVEVHSVAQLPVLTTAPALSTRLFNDDKFGIRADANTRWGLLSAYYFFDKYTLDNPYGQSSLPGFDVVDTGQAQVINLSDTKSGWNENGQRIPFRIHSLSIVTNGAKGGLGPSPSSQGFVEGPNTLGIIPLIPSLQGVVPVAFNNYSIGVGGPTNNYLNTFQWLDNFSRVVGNHSLKFGGTFNWLPGLPVHPQLFQWQLYFTGQETGSDFVDFLIGAPSYFAQGQFARSHFRTRYAGLYAQDSWRAMPQPDTELRSALGCHYALV